MRDQYIEQFLAQLRENPDAPAPPGMDAEEAEFIRKLAKTSTQPAAHLKPLIWQRVLNAAQKESHMILSQPISKTGKQPISLTWVAAAAVILLVAAALIVAMNFNFTPDSNQSAAPLRQQTEEVTPAPPTSIPSLVPSSGIDASFTPTPVGGMPLPTVVPGLSDTITSTPIGGGINPPMGYVPVVTVFVPIRAGELIQADMLTIVYWQSDRRPSGSFERLEDVVGQYATTDLPRFMPILEGQTGVDSATATPIPTVTRPPTETLTPTSTPSPMPTGGN